MAAFSHKWFPGREVTPRAMGEALFLEKDYWEKQRMATAAGVAMAFNGR
ncbi:DUF6890 family protein [Desulfoluna spongiiphila]|nr:hypothetical protein [Desulfoluna spongiiphila]